MAEIKHYRENESKIHEALYGNLFLLSKFYPTSSDFDAIFKKDMFVKNNKAAFFEVAYYLLNILNPELTKEKLTSWPPYDIKRENKFRMEVLKYINELNVLYDNADIPHMMSSQLIAPSGLKFTKFMLKLSQLVMYEHLKRTTEDEVLYRPKASKNKNLCKVTLNNLKKKTSLIRQETNNVVKNFESLHSASKEKAQLIHAELQAVNNKIRAAKQENVTVKEEFSKNHLNYPSQDTITKKINSLKSQYEGFQEIHKLFLEVEGLIKYLHSSDLVLDHCKEELKLPNEVLHIVKSQEELDLTEFFQALNVLLEKKALEFPYPTDSSINSNTQKVEELKIQYAEINNHFMDDLRELQETMEKMTEQLKSLVEDNENEVEETLAVPLSD